MTSKVSRPWGGRVFRHENSSRLESCPFSPVTRRRTVGADCGPRSRTPRREKRFAVRSAWDQARLRPDAARGGSSDGCVAQRPREWRAAGGKTAGPRRRTALRSTPEAFSGAHAARPPRPAEAILPRDGGRSRWRPRRRQRCAGAREAAAREPGAPRTSPAHVPRARPPPRSPRGPARFPQGSSRKYRRDAASLHVDAGVHAANHPRYRAAARRSPVESRERPVAPTPARITEACPAGLLLAAPRAAPLPQASPG